MAASRRGAARLRAALAPTRYGRRSTRTRARLASPLSVPAAARRACRTRRSPRQQGRTQLSRCRGRAPLQGWLSLLRSVALEQIGDLLVVLVAIELDQQVVGAQFVEIVDRRVFVQCVRRSCTMSCILSHRSCTGLW